MVHFIELVNQQHTGVFILQCMQQRTGTEKLLAMQFCAQALPINAAGLGLEFDPKPL